MAKNRPTPATRASSGEMSRLQRPIPLAAQVERLLREAIAEGRYASGRLPTEVELAEQLGVSRETVRLAAEVLQREGLLVKIRRKGTFTQAQTLSLKSSRRESAVLAYLQASYPAGHGAEEAVTASINSLMLQGAVAEAGRAGRELLVRDAPSTQIKSAFQRLEQKAALGGVVFASFGEEKLLRRITGRGIPTVLLDHDLHLPNISSVREDSFGGARLAIEHLAGLGHRRIAMAHWQRTDLNPWRLDGYRQGLRDAGLMRRRQWEIPAELTERGAKLAAERLLALSPRPTAVYCFNNTLAQRMIEELRRRGARVPDDLSVMGGGGEEVFGLTCHQADWQQLGRQAVQMLLRCMNAETPPKPEHHLSPHYLRPGQTTSPHSLVGN